MAHDQAREHNLFELRKTGMHSWGASIGRVKTASGRDSDRGGKGKTNPQVVLGYWVASLALAVERPGHETDMVMIAEDLP